MRRQPSDSEGVLEGRADEYRNAWPAGRRAIDLTGKAWSYLLDVLTRPIDIPLLARSIIVQRAHGGETIRLSRHRRFLAETGINTVIDVGANTGQFSSAILALLPQASVYAFEPLPECFKILTRRLGHRNRFHAFQMALGDEQRQDLIWQSSFWESSSLLEINDTHRRNFPWAASRFQVPINVRTLDSFIQSFDLAPRVMLKIDVEGYEMHVLAGAQELLTTVDFVLTEVSLSPLYQGQASFDDVHNFLGSRNFVYAGNLDQLISPIDGAILQADALFARS